MATWKCPGCGEMLSAPDSSVALRLRCTQCGQVFQTEPTSPPSGGASEAPEPRRRTSLPRSAIAILALCACAVVGVVLYTFVLGGPAVVVPEEPALSEKPAPTSAAAGEDQRSPTGPVVAAGPTGSGTTSPDSTGSPRVRPEPKATEPPVKPTLKPPVWPPAPPPKPPEPAKKPEPKAPPAKPAEPKKAPPTVAAKPPPKPAKPPAPKADPDEPMAADDPLVRVVSALYLGKVDEASGRLQAMADQQKNNPLYQLALGQRHTRASDNAKATGAYRTAVGLDPQLPDAYLYLGTSYAIGGRVPQALEQLKVGQGLAPKDPRFTYAEGLAHFRARDWEKSKAAFDALAPKGGSLGPIAKERAGRVAGVKAVLGQIQTQKAGLDKSLQGVQENLKKVRGELSTAEAKKESLRKKYNSERSTAERRYYDRVRQANRQYDRTVNDYRRNYSDDRYRDSHRRKREAARRRDDDIAKARRDRDRAYDQLAARYKPQVAPLNADINRLKREVAKQMQEQTKVRNEVAKLRREEMGQLVPPKIDIAGDVRTILPLRPSRMRELVQARKSAKGRSAPAAKPAAVAKP